jgi:hypothetical protein
MEKLFREAKYKNETGAKQGQWFMNRFDYFEFHQYPQYNKHLYLSGFSCLFFFYLANQTIYVSFLLFLFCSYFSVISLCICYVLKKQICRYEGYFLFPKFIVRFLRAREKDVDLLDFDSIATMGTGGDTKDTFKRLQNIQPSIQ